MRLLGSSIVKFSWELDSMKAAVCYKFPLDRKGRLHKKDGSPVLQAMGTGAFAERGGGGPVTSGTGSRF